MIAGGGNKLPFGNLSRLILAWVCTEAVCTQSRDLVLGSSLSEFMQSLGIYTTDGNAHTRLRNQMKRLFHASVQLTYEDEQVSASINSPVASRTEFWWNGSLPGEQAQWANTVELGEKFFQEIIRHPVPLDLNILKALKRSPLGLDLYLWLTYRSFTLKRPLWLSWARLYRQFGVDPVQADDKRTVDYFRTDCLRELVKIKTTWPDLNYATAQGVLVLSPSKPAILPGNSFRLWNSRPQPFSGSESPLKALGGQRYPRRRKNALRASEAMFIHRNLSSEGVFHDQTPGHSYS